MTDNDAAKALEDLAPFLDAKQPPFSDGAKVIWIHAETIRTALSKAAKVDGLLDVVKMVYFVLDTATKDLKMGEVKYRNLVQSTSEHLEKALQRFNGEV